MRNLVKVLAIATLVVSLYSCKDENADKQQTTTEDPKNEVNEAEKKPEDTAKTEAPTPDSISAKSETPVK